MNIFKKFTKYDWVIFSFIIYFVIGFVLAIIFSDDQANSYLRELTDGLPGTFGTWLIHVAIRFLVLPLMWPATVSVLFG